MTNPIEFLKIAGAVSVAIFAIWKFSQPAMWIWNFTKKSINEDLNVKLDSIIETLKQQDVKLETIADNQAYQSIVQQSILELNEVMWWKSDSEGKTIEVSPRTCQVLKLEEKAFLGSNWVNRVPIEQHEKLFQEWANSIQYDRDYIFEYDIRDGNNKLVHLLAHAKKAGSNWFGVLKVA